MLIFHLDATYVHELSTFDADTYGHNRLAIDKLNAVIHYVQDHYLPNIVSYGHHILYSLPVWKSGTKLPEYSVTSIAFQVYSKQVVDRRNWSIIPKSAQPVILILGMHQFRPLPSLRLPYGTNWHLYGTNNTSYGSVALSREISLTRRLLSLLASVNAATTVVPVWLDVLDGDWRLEVTTWANSKKFKKDALDGGCGWKSSGSSASSLDYTWDHYDEWTYKGKVDSVIHDAYKVTCKSDLYHITYVLKKS